MAWRDATESELTQIGGGAPAKGWRDATPEEEASMSGASPAEVQQGFRSGDVAARRKQVEATITPQEKADAASGKSFSLLPKPTGREELTIPGEFMGGLSDIGTAIKNAANQKLPSITDPISLQETLGVLGLVMPPKPFAEAAAGGIRTAASPAAPLVNNATRLANLAEWAVGKIPGAKTSIPGTGISPSDIVAGIVAGAGDYFLPAAAGKAARLTKEAAIKHLPTYGEQTANITAKGEEGAAAIEAQRKAAADRAIQLRDAQIKSIDEAKGTARAGTEQGIEAEKQAALAKAQQQTLAEQRQAEAVARQQKEPHTRAEIEARAHEQQPGQPTAKDVGEAYNKPGGEFDTKKRASSKAFSNEYEAQVAAGRAAPSVDTKGYLQASQDIKTELGITAPPAKSAAEKVAGKVENVFESAGESEDTLNALKKQLSEVDDNNRGRVLSTIDEHINANPELKQKIEARTVTPGDLIVERQRLKSAERAAHETGKYNLERQFAHLRQGVESDIPQHFMDKIAELDSRYKTQHIPFFGPKATTRIAAQRSAETVVDRFIPKNTDPARVEKSTQAFKLLDDPLPVRRAFYAQGVDKASRSENFGKGLVKWWDDYADVKTGDHVLKTALGPDYNHWKDITDRLRTVKPKDIDTTLKHTIAEINKQGKEALSGIESAAATKQSTLSGVMKDAESMKADLYKRGLKTTENLGKTSQEQRIALEKQIADQVKAVTGEKMDPKRIKNYGMFIMVEGGISSVIGSPTGVLRGIAGGLMVMAPNTIAKLVNLPGGAQLMRRGLRAVAGTQQAAATARQIQNLIQKADKETK